MVVFFLNRSELIYSNSAVGTGQRVCDHDQEFFLRTRKDRKDTQKRPYYPGVNRKYYLDFRSSFS